MSQNDNTYAPFSYDLLLKAVGKQNGTSIEIAIMNYVIKRSKAEYTCNRPPGAAGALIVAAGGIIFAGVYPPYGTPTCHEDGCEIEWSALDNHMADISPHCIRTIHAERRAIYRAARFGVITEDAVIYSVLKPCYECSKAIVAAGIKVIFYAGAAYDEPRTQRILENGGVLVHKLDVGLEYGQ